MVTEHSCIGCVQCDDDSVTPEHILRMKYDTLMHMVQNGSYVGHEAAELLAVGLMTPVHIVEPQLSLQGLGYWQTPSLRISHGAHFTPAVEMDQWPEWPDLDRIMLQRNHGRCRMPRPPLDRKRPRLNSSH